MERRFTTVRWPSGLRRQTKDQGSYCPAYLVLRGVGSNPTLIKIFFSLSLKEKEYPEIWFVRTTSTNVWYRHGYPSKTRKNFHFLAWCQDRLVVAGLVKNMYIWNFVALRRPSRQIDELFPAHYIPNYAFPERRARAEKVIK